MPDLTIAVDRQALKKARQKAIENNTTIEELVREFLQSLCNETPDQEEATKEFLAIAEEAGGSSGGGERTWTREELYDRPNRWCKP